MSDPTEPRHCDDYIDDHAAPAPLRAFLEWARSPAHGHTRPKPYPTLFATYKGRRVRVTMASRMGDVGISSDHTATGGYDARVYVEQLTDFSAGLA